MYGMKNPTGSIGSNVCVSIKYDTEIASVNFDTAIKM